MPTPTEIGWHNDILRDIVLQLNAMTSAITAVQVQLTTTNQVLKEIRDEMIRANDKMEELRM